MATATSSTSTPRSRTGSTTISRSSVPGGLKLADIVAGEGPHCSPRWSAAPGEVKTEVLDLDLKTRSGRSVPARLFHKVAFGADGAPGPSRTLVLNRARDDGTDPQRAAEVRFMRFFHNTPMAIATVDREGRIARTNARFARLFQGVLRRRGGRGPLDPLRRRRARSRGARSGDAQGAAGPERHPPRRRRARRRRRTLRARSMSRRSRRTSANGEAAIVYALETTAQRTLENQFAQPQKMQAVGQLAGGIAHDFNNLLSAIMMATDFLLNAHKPTDPSFQDIMQIKQNANRAASLVRQLLAFSRRQTLRPQVLDLGEVLSDLAMLLRRLIGEKVTLDVVHGRDLWPVKADIKQFEQVIVNLAVNARDAMPDGGKLTVRTANVTAEESARYRQQGHAARRIRAGRGRRHRHRHRAGHHREDLRAVLLDQGGRQGHRARALDRLRHRQADRRLHLSGDRSSARARRSASSCRATSDGRGEPSAEMEDDRDGGALAAADQRGARSPTPISPARAPSSWSRTRRPARRSTRAGCGRAAIRCSRQATASRRIEAFERQGGKVDLVVSDVVMPEMDGPTLLKELRKRNPDLKIIFVSGYAEDAFEKNLPAGGQFGFLPKPFTLKQLVAAVKETMATSDL